MLCKAVAPHPLNVGAGRMLAAGESADLDPTDPDVALLLSLGSLAAVPAPARATKKTTPTEET